MKNFAKRLKEERERLGLSQAKFAQSCDVGRTAQFNYERGEREPSYAYMREAEKLGVDAAYVFTGVRAGKDWGYARAHTSMLYTIEMLLGLEEGQLERLASEGIAKEVNLWLLNDDQRAADALTVDDWQRSMIAWLGTSRKIDRCVDPVLLSHLLDAVERSATRLNVSLPTEKRVRAALILYRNAKPQKNTRFPHRFSEQLSGSVSQDTIDDAVKLAAG